MHLILFLSLYVSSYSLTIGELFSNKNTVKNFYIDEWLSDLQINDCGPSTPKPKFVNQKQWTLIKLTQSLPIRIINDKGLFKLMQPGFRRHEESLNFRSSLIAITTKDLIDKLNSMNSWFLRSQVTFRLHGKEEQFTIIDFSSSKEFYLNQFHSDFEEFSRSLFGQPQYCLNTSINDWLDLQRDLIYENHAGLIPNPYGNFNPDFSKISRTAPGSNLPPLSHSEDQFHP